ncbi:uncharacterized protein CELE_Y116A8C.463 [Caenorhabditis elegans]|uniref:Uncharacterized protein n=1 Tax=Caenorhabditis elegans TaxID=6239 RepID=C5VUK0_CAEEL|nr:Uncharacterized protein CELE_Y116A8C.463 [Caenorhabditis elegans]CAZ65537.3 Uncharacterized protein CELE_Y116A8C.463 [Caenorhabditis elegans]|eukprot:NP_001255912.3 Uncharacterized protein CELE_Y116A8C.463 [Caenorhabditis elegans]
MDAYCLKTKFPSRNRFGKMFASEDPPSLALILIQETMSLFLQQKSQIAALTSC